MLQEMHSGILSKPLWIDPACSPPGDTLGELECSPEEHTSSCLASGRTVSHFLSPCLSIPSHLYYSGHKAKDTCSLSRATSFTKQALPLGEWQLQSIHQPPGCKREAFSHLWESNKYSARDSLAFLIISAALGVDPHHRQDPIWTQDLPEQSSDKWNPLWWHFFFPHQALFLHFPAELSLSFTHYPPFEPNKAVKPALAESPLCFPPSPECPQGTSSSSTGTWAPQPQVTECSNFKIVVVTSFVGQY